MNLCVCKCGEDDNLFTVGEFWCNTNISQWAWDEYNLNGGKNKYKNDRNFPVHWASTQYCRKQPHENKTLLFCNYISLLF